MSTICVKTVALLLTGTSAGLLHAQQAATGPAIIIVGQRPLFGVPPERTLGEEDISAYGTNDVGELLNEVTTENGESPDEPVILVNGKPVASLDDISDFPAEAVAQVQVLPRGSGTRVGASADRRVYNIVLKKQADIGVGRAAMKVATDGGWAGREFGGTYTNIRGERRINGSLRLGDDDALRESERHIIEPAGSLPGLSHYRTLQGSNRSIQLGATASEEFNDWLSGSATAKLKSGRRHSLLGLAAADTPLSGRARSTTGNFDMSLNAERGPWTFTLLGKYEFDRRRSANERRLSSNPGGVGLSRTTSRITNASADLTASGPLFDLPAGPLRLTLGAGVARDSVSGSHSFADNATRDDFVQSTTDGMAGLDIPLTSRTNKFLGGLGELSASLQFNRSHVSHFGSLSSQTYALTWQPFTGLRLFGSVTTGRTPPDVGLVAEPILETPGVPYFDPLRNETVEVTQISGGNPDLSASRGTNRRLTANLKPIKSLPLQLTAEYSSVRNRDIITALPAASDLIFLAFPERFIRDPNGVLRSVDVRPVQFFREDRDQLRYGINLNLPLGARDAASDGPAKAAAKAPPQATGAAPEARDDQDEDAPSAPRAGRSAGRPRLQFNLSHTLILKSDLRMSADVEPIDLLSPNAIGIGGGSRPRHQLDMSVGYSERGLGVRVTGQYRSKSFLRLVGDGQSDVLRFSPLTTFSLRAWAEPARLFGDSPILKRSRLTLSVVNLTNQRQRVRNSAGETPLAYQPGYRDPLGRTVQLEFRKTF